MATTMDERANVLNEELSKSHYFLEFNGHTLDRGELSFCRQLRKHVVASGSSLYPGFEVLFSDGEHDVLGIKVKVVNWSDKWRMYFVSEEEAKALGVKLAELNKEPVRNINNVIYELTKNGWYNSRNKRYEIRDSDQLIGYADYLEKVSKDIDVMKEHQEFLKKLGESHSLNYLLFGPAGVGKTTFIKTLATKFNLPVYVVKGGDLMTFSIDYILNPPSATLCLLLFEDFDRYLALKSGSGDMTMADILNAMDGIQHSNPIIRIFTGNNCDVIFKNEALLSRMSNKFQFFYPTLEHYETKLRKFLTFHKDSDINQSDLSALLKAINEIVVPAHTSLRAFSAFVARYFSVPNFLNVMRENLKELTVDYTKINFVAPTDAIVPKSPAKKREIAEVYGDAYYDDYE